MDRETKVKIANICLQVIVPVMIGGLAMVANPALGVVIVSGCAAALWSIAIWVRYPESLARRRVQYGGYIIIAITALTLALLLRFGGPDAPKDSSQTTLTPQPVTATAQNSPGANVVAIAEANNVTVNPIDSQKLDGMDRKLDTLLSGNEILHLKQKYPLGFVEVSTISDKGKIIVLPHTSRIEMDFNKVTAWRDANNYICVSITDWHDTLRGGRVNGIALGAYAVAGAKSKEIALGGVAIVAECIRVSDDGFTIVLGFREIAEQPSK